MKSATVPGSVEQQSVVISGGQFSRYMAIADIEAEHVTLALANAVPRVEVQLLRYRQPEPIRDSDITRLDEPGFNREPPLSNGVATPLAVLIGHPAAAIPQFPLAPIEAHLQNWRSALA